MHKIRINIDKCTMLTHQKNAKQILRVLTKRQFETDDMSPFIFISIFGAYDMMTLKYRHAFISYQRTTIELTVTDITNL